MSRISCLLPNYFAICVYPSQSEEALIAEAQAMAHTADQPSTSVWTDHQALLLTVLSGRQP